MRATSEDELNVLHRDNRFSAESLALRGHSKGKCDSRYFGDA